jgi:hypothetical protein
MMISVEDFPHSASGTVKDKKKPAFHEEKRAKEYKQEDL